MKGTVLCSPRDVRFKECPDPAIVQPTEAIVRVTATCICGSDLWPYRGIDPVTGLTPMGHEYVGVVEEVGSAVRAIRPLRGADDRRTGPRLAEMQGTLKDRLGPTASSRIVT